MQLRCSCRSLESSLKTEKKEEPALTVVPDASVEVVDATNEKDLAKKEQEEKKDDETGDYSQEDFESSLESSQQTTTQPTTTQPSPHKD